KKGSLGFPLRFGAGDESRTRDLNLGKVALYQLSYSRVEKEIITHLFTPVQATLKMLGWPAFSA
ncbi:MAG: hypothetical protein RLZZ484_316, partial [Pseudomonadota bacterium]